MVTSDLISTLENRYKKILSKRTKQKINRLEDEFLEKFWDFIPDNIAKESLDAEELAEGIKKRISKEELPVITLDDIYIKPEEVSGYLSICRITDATGNISGLGPRPGDKSLDQQLEDLTKKFDKIALVDIGAFGGDTTVEVINLFQSKGIKVGRVYLGVCGQEAIDKIKKMTGVPVTAERIYTFYEWIELRDFFGIDGRKTADGAIRPYWENLTKWASIPEKNAEDVKKLCIEYNKKLQDILNTQLFIFDLDGTLYSFKEGSFEQSDFAKEIRDRSVDFIASKLGTTKQEAERIREYINSRYGGEISIGVEKEFDIPRDEYFNYVWDIDARKYLSKDEKLVDLLRRIPGKKVILTTAPKIWAERALKALGVDGLFDDIFTGEPDVRKPNPEAFRQILEKYRCKPKDAVMIGDSPKEDIIPARKLGIETILIRETGIYALEKLIRGETA
ncbi:MAG: HAD-IA family hydrolase [Candidatus Nanoarchaeia archaeon]|nr:HAD-IA family hydrolase [Candidatus Jingweiarchaeum tengchongense]